jgi:hypothetical protein
MGQIADWIRFWILDRGFWIEIAGEATLFHQDPPSKIPMARAWSQTRAKSFGGKVAYFGLWIVDFGLKTREH